MANVIWNFIGLILGITSIVATVYFAIKYYERKTPCFHFSSYTNITKSKDTSDTIDIYYLGTKVPRVSTTMVRFWNAGKKPIRREDVPSTQPLLMTFSDSAENLQILNVNVLKMSRDAVDFKAIKATETSVSVDFDFLDHTDGATIEIQHTGTWRTTAKINGIILGASNGIKLIPDRLYGITGFDFFPLMPFRPRAYSRLPMAFRIFATIAMIVIISSLIWFLLNSTNDIVTNSELLKKSLSSYISSQNLPALLIDINNSSKLKTLNTYAPYLMSFFFLLNLLFGLFLIWGKRHPFPTSLLIRRSDKKTIIDMKNMVAIQNGNSADCKLNGVSITDLSPEEERALN